MEKTIHILPQQLADKIAAGEVVGRPASAVKELIENSIDAKASSVTVVIKDGGTSLIQVIDNGTGMNADDARLAFARHATSKIASYDDLENIRTLGFRGEALASIAAVSHVELRTRLQSSDVGTKVKIDGGEHLEVVPDGAVPGTVITVRNLFYNMPGRRNFLKSPQTEYKYIVDVFQRAALAHPSIAMKLISNEETIFSLPSATLHDRVKELLGEQLSSTLLFFEEKTEFAGIQGFLGKPDFARKTRTEQYLFLNYRSIA
ncbi:MAG TPA: DNA mismatch repair endonuclease MutL, partial [Bacteroidota bacterium]|nr:DNA mismatch repair endonuclease MutL [Bacteroidota bacterium]